MKRLLYILTLLTLSLNSFSFDDKNAPKENGKTIVIKVSDVNGEELPGAKISIEENGKEYVADFNGTVQVQIKSNENLTFKIQSIGFEVKSIHANELTTFNEFTLKNL